MRLRNAVMHKPMPHGPVAKTITYLSLHGFTAFDALMLPFHLLFAGIMLATPASQMNASPVYSELTDIAPIEVWACLLVVLAVSIILSIVSERWFIARISWTLVCAWWLVISGLVYVAATTLLSPAVYVLIAMACLYRQAEIAVGYGDGRE